MGGLNPKDKQAKQKIMEAMSTIIDKKPPKQEEPAEICKNEGKDGCPKTFMDCAKCNKCKWYSGFCLKHEIEDPKVNLCITCNQRPPNYNPYLGGEVGEHSPKGKCEQQQGGNKGLCKWKAGRCQR